MYSREVTSITDLQPTPDLITHYHDDNDDEDNDDYYYYDVQVCRARPK